MKRRRYLILMMIATFGLCACGNSEPAQVEAPKPVIQIVEQTSSPVIVIPEDYKEEVPSVEEEPSTAPEIIPLADEKQVTYQVVETLYEEGSVRIVYPLVSGMEDESLQTQINQNVEALMLKDIHTEGLSSYDLKYEIYSQGTGIFSFALKGTALYEGAPYPINIVKTFNIDMTTGKNLRLKDYTDISVLISNLESAYGYEMISDIDDADFSTFLNNGYVLDYAITMLDYDFDFSNLDFIPTGYSAIKDNHVVLFLEAEHAMGDYVEIQFTDTLTK